MTIHEPATLVTDLLLAALAGGLSWHLRRARPAIPAARWWSAALACTSASALVGGLYHGFAPNFSPAVAPPWWTLTLLTICLVAAAMDLALVHEAVPAGRQRAVMMVVGLKFAAFAAAAVNIPQFVIAIINYGLTMLLWAAAATMLRRAWSRAMLAGIGLSIIAAAVQQLRIGISAHFNHNDFYHLIQAFALIAFYRAGHRFTAAKTLN